MNSTSLPASTRIGAVHLAVADLADVQAFYADALSFQADAKPGLTTLSAGGTPLLVLHEQPGATPKPPRTTGLYHFAILYPDRRALARALERLLAMRYPLQGASDHLVSEAIYLADPEGNGIEIYADRPRQAWPRRDGRIEMATNPLDLDSLMAELDRPGADEPGLPPATTIGHVHLHVNRIESAQAFYCDLLGFDLVTRYGPSAFFVSAGGYHHHLGLNTWAGTDAPPPPAQSTGLRYFEVLVPDVGALDAIVQRLGAADVPHEWDKAGGVRLQDPASNGLRIAVG